MSYLGLATEIFEINREYTREELHDKLHRLCDSDFNGDNGEDYYRLDENMSDLEFCINESLNAKESLQELIKSVLDANYKYDTYYKSYEVNFIRKNDLLIVSVATIS